MRAKIASRSWNNLLVLLLVASALLAGVYFSLRYAGWYMEVDASRQSTSADGILVTGRLVHSKSYDNGFAYGAQLALVSLLAGLPVQAIQLGSAVWVFVVALAAFIAYREFLGSTPLAVLGVFLLFVQPDFLFYVLRGSHEKTTWAYALLMLFLLLRSYRHVRNPRRLIIDVLLFYLLFFAMTAGNAYFASTFINAVIISLLAGLILDRFRKESGAEFAARLPLLRRLLVISLVGVMIVYIFINYLYKPAFQYYQVFSSLVDRVSLMFLGGQAAETPVTYSYFEAGWRSSSAYLLLTAVQWAIAISSLIVWVYLLSKLPRLNLRIWLLWLFYTGFGLLLAFSVVADFAGVMNTNLQLRIFTPFTLFSSPLVAYGVYRVYRRVTGKSCRWVVALGTALFVYASVAALLKVTNDPAFGNQWFFYSPAELTASQWMDTNFSGQTVWLDTNGHLNQIIEFWKGFNRPKTFTYEYGWQSSPEADILISKPEFLRANRLGYSLPVTTDHNRVYDNGDVQLYRPRAWTPHQH